MRHHVRTAFLRAALAVGFLSAVADRVGLWGPPGAPSVVWGDMSHFMPYVATLNPWFPAAVIPLVGWGVTAVEAILGICLLTGFQTRLSAWGSGVLLLAFAVGMVVGVGAKAPLDYSVLAASAGAFVLATALPDRWSIDHAMSRRGAEMSPL